MKRITLFTIFSSILSYCYVYAQCPNGFTRMQSNSNKCYKYIYEPGIIADIGFEMCSTYNAAPISIGSVYENSELTQIITNTCNGSSCGSAWIGLMWNNFTSDNNSYTWIDGSSITYFNVDYSNKYCNDEFFGEHFFLSWNQYWYNCPFSNYNGQIHGVICEYWINKPTTAKPATTTIPLNCPPGWYQSVTNKQNCYLFISNSVSWDKANFDCLAADERSTLVSVSSAYEDTELLTKGSHYAPQCNEFSLGLHQKNENSPWLWLNNDTSSYRKWQDGFPNYSHGNGQNCVFMESDGTWQNWFCDYETCYICEIKL